MRNLFIIYKIGEMYKIHTIFAKVFQEIHSSLHITRAFD